MKVPQFQPFIDNQEYEAIKECFDTNWLTEGLKSREFVNKLCCITETKYGVLAPNGTLALYLGLRALGIGDGDEVIVPNFTFIASATSVEMTGATPVFVDVGKDLQVDVEKCKKVLTKRTKAIMPVHIYGMSCDMTKVMDFAKKANIEVIEDAAQALGVRWLGKPCGSFGKVSCFSFFADKTITTIEGGFVTTNDERIYESLLYLRNQGRKNRGSFIHPEIGYNFRMNDVQATIGLVQLKKFKEIKRRKDEIANLYKKLLKDNKSIEIINPILGSTQIPFRVGVLWHKENLEEVVSFLQRNEIETRSFFYPLHKQPCFVYLNHEKDEFFQNSMYAYEHGICLPTFPSIKDEQIHFVCEKLNEAASVL